MKCINCKIDKDFSEFYYRNDSGKHRASCKDCEKNRVNNKVLTPYKQGSQFTSNVIEYKITNNTSNIYTAILINNSTILTLEDNISGSLYAYTSADIGNRLAPYILDSYILL